MNFLQLLEILTLYQCDYDLQDVTITSNKINNISFLILKNKEGKVFDCIILEDHRYEPVEEYTDLRLK